MLRPPTGVYFKKVEPVYLAVFYLRVASISELCVIQIYFLLFPQVFGMLKEVIVVELWARY